MTKLSTGKRAGVGGRPRKYQTAASLQKKIDGYFKKQETSDKPPTIQGLCRVVGLDRKALLEYGDQSEFSNTIKVARAKIREGVEERLIGGQQNVAGLIFWLKNNAKYSDTHKIDGNLHVTFADFAKLGNKEQ